MNWLDIFGAVREQAEDRNEPMYARIVHAVKAGIASGQLVDNSRLPTNRELSNILQIDRSTVARAYLELSQEGLIDSHVGRGTFVKLSSGKPALVFEAPAFAWSEKFSRSSQTQFDILGRQPATAHAPGMISFAGGIPTSEFYPHERFEKIVERLIKSGNGEEMFAYSASEGHPLLRSEVLKYLHRQQIRAGDDELLILNGSQQGIDLVTGMLVDPGDIVLMEEPTYLWAVCNFRSRQARCVPVPLDEEGIRLDALEASLSRTKAKLLYVIPNFQNPTGATMSYERRKGVLELARRYQVPVLEDNFAGDLRYEGEALPALRALPGSQDLVIHQSTFSKALCPGLRLGWLLAPPEVMSRLRIAKRTSDLSTNSMAQVVLAHYLKEGFYTAHLEHVRAVYKARLDAMHTALKTHVAGIKCSGTSESVTWSRPAGGLFVWAKLPDGWSARDLLAYAEREGVTFSPGDLCFLGNDRVEYMRLCFIQTEEQAIEQGVNRLAKAIEKYSDYMKMINSSQSLSKTRRAEHALI